MGILWFLILVMYDSISFLTRVNVAVDNVGPQFHLQSVSAHTVQDTDWNT